MGVLSELRRRNVFRMAVLYAVAAWLVMQVAEVVIGLAKLPDWIGSTTLALLAIGFPIALIFSWFYELTPQGITLEKDVGPGESVADIPGRRLDFIVISLLFAAVILFAYDKWWIGEPPDKSIAILPFVNVSSDEEMDFFSDGITDEILNSLASIRELKVAGRTSAFAFKGQNRDLRTIGDILGVQYILEGSIRRSGSTVRITAQLVHVTDGFPIWSETYDRELTDVFAVQDEISKEVVVQLEAQLLNHERKKLISRRTDPEVYDNYLLAKQRLYRRSQMMTESAIELLDKAIAKDPDYAPAYATRGIATMLLTDGSTPDWTVISQGKGYIDSALQMDPQLAEAWAGLGLYYHFQPTKHNEAIGALKKALSINPSLTDARVWLHLAMVQSGDVRTGSQVLEDLMQRDPLHLAGFQNAVATLDEFGREDEAQDLIDTFRKYDPTNPILLKVEAWHHLLCGRAAEGVRLAEKAYQLMPTSIHAQTIYAFGLIATLQIERAAVEGSSTVKAYALEFLGRRDAAYEIAAELAKHGYLRNLFIHYNRANRSQNLINYVEERWPDLDAFAAQYPHDNFGYELMVEVAFAYFREGNMQRFNEALLLVEQALSNLSEQGIDNWVFMLEHAKYLALSGQQNNAIDQLEAAVDRGLRVYDPAADYMLMFKPLVGDPRFAAVQTAILDKINVDSQALGLEPVDPVHRLSQ
jgi:TolB-like protein